MLQIIFIVLKIDIWNVDIGYNHFFFLHEKEMANALWIESLKLGSNPILYTDADQRILLPDIGY